MDRAHRPGVLICLLALMAAAPAGGPEPIRCLIHVSTDKPIYGPGETLHARAVFLDAFTRKPLPASVVLSPSFDVLGPRDERVTTVSARTQDGVASATWKVPEGQPGGRYRLVVREASAGLPPGERRFEVREHRVPRLKSQITFAREGYGPGDEVSGVLRVARAEGGAPVGAAVTMVATVDGREAVRQRAGVVDGGGACPFTFVLPQVIEHGEGTLGLVIEDGGVVETAARTIPILLRDLSVSVHPESGDLVAGLGTRIYVEARTPAGKPADVAGVVEDATGSIVTAFRTVHEGRGRFDLVPRAGGAYRLRITEPASVGTLCELPAVRGHGASLSSLDPVTPAGAPIRLRLAATRSGVYRLTAAQRERVVALRRVKLTAGLPARVRLPLRSDLDGVLRITLAPDDGAPIAERLVFRRPARQLHVLVEPDRQQHAPRDEVEVRVRTTTTGGQPVPAVVGLWVTDHAALEMVETRDKAPRLPAQALIEAEVTELADAQAYLTAGGPAPGRQLDLLLGTQGWRRFPYANVEAFLKQHGDPGRRALAHVRPLHEWTVHGIEVRAHEDIVQTERTQTSTALNNEFVENIPALGRSYQNLLLMAPGTAQGDGFFGGDPTSRGARSDANQYLFDGGDVAALALASRSDFRETVYWNPVLRTDPVTGEARVRFTLSDSVTTFAVMADAFADDGALGAGAATVVSKVPLALEPKLPLEVTVGDRVLAPVAVTNETGADAPHLALTASSDGGMEVHAPEPFPVPGGGRARGLVALHVRRPGETTLTVSAETAGGADRVTRKVRVAPRGFPAEIAAAGIIEPGGRARHEIVVPADAVAGSLETSAVAYVTPLGGLTSSLERLLLEPHGCFEQTSSTSYPLVMAQQYFRSHPGVDAAVVAKADELLARSYQRLTSFECPGRGYEWYGQDPAHEALTAYGLLQFHDMAAVRQVDAAMVARTRDWLLSRRDGNGGFLRDGRALHHWVADADATRAYVLWALLETGAAGLDREVEALARASRVSDCSYVLALSANVLSHTGRTRQARALMERLASRQAKSGAVDGARTSIVGSTGRSLAVETTALAALAWLGDDGHAVHADRAIRYLAETCKGGLYGSTQGTVLALRAIVAHDAARAHPRAPGALTLVVDGKPTGAPLRFDAKTEGALELPDVAPFLTPGRHLLELAMERGSRMPYAVSVRLHRDTPESSPFCPLGLRVRLDRQDLTEGDVAEAEVVLENTTRETVPSPIVIVGVPGGMEPRHAQLDELQRAGTIAAYEVKGREVFLYLRGIAAGVPLRVPISLVATIPGDYTGPASRAYAYYGSEHKAWVPGMAVRIAP